MLRLRPLLALDLGAVHDAPAARVERIAPMHGAAIVPQHQIADAPDVLPGELRPVDEAPQLVEQRLGVRERKPEQIGVAAPAEIEHAPAGIGMRAHQRVHGARRGQRIVGRRDALAHIAAAVVGAVMLDLEAGDADFEPAGSAS